MPVTIRVPPVQYDGNEKWCGGGSEISPHVAPTEDRCRISSAHLRIDVLDFFQIGRQPGDQEYPTNVDPKLECSLIGGS